MFDLKAIILYAKDEIMEFVSGNLLFLYFQSVMYFGDGNKTLTN